MTAETTTLSSEADRPPVPSLAENLATMAQRTARLESELDALAGTNTFPEWWYQGGVSFSELKSQLSNPEADPQAISQSILNFRGPRERQGLTKYY